MAKNKVEICGVDTSKLPVLKNDEMRFLFKRMQKGELDAREQLVNGNLRLVLSVIKDLIIVVKIWMIYSKLAVLD